MCESCRVDEEAAGEAQAKDEASTEASAADGEEPLPDLEEAGALLHVGIISRVPAPYQPAALAVLRGDGGAGGLFARLALSIGRRMLPLQVIPGDQMGSKGSDMALMDPHDTHLA